MYTHRSPPKSSNKSAGGSSHSNILSSSTTTGGSKLSLYSNSSSSGLLNSGSSESIKNHHHSHYQYHSHHSGGGSDCGGAGTSSGRGSLSGSAMKRGKKQHWGVKSTRDRAGMSFLIVIVFFAVFGLIILTELFMIDERSHGGMVVLRHGGNLGGRLGDSMPDYDGPKDDYDLMDSNLMIDNKLGFVQFRDNKLKIQDADNNEVGRLAGILLKTGANGAAGGGGVGGGVSAVNMPLMPWGKVLATNVEETLPHYPIGTQPTDGSWQVVNGTRFKFFVFSAYYDRRDGAELVRVIGATKTRGPERVYCRFWYMNRNVSNSGGGGQQQRGRYTSATVMARVRIIRENWNLKYSACFVLCPVRGAPELGVPQFVSIVSRLRAPPGNLLTLRNTDWDPDFATNRSTGGAGGIAASVTLNSSSTSTSSSSASSTPMADSPPPRGDHIADKIAICVKPFHFNYDQALYLMEYVEFYALLGVSHFTFYNHTIGPHASCVLRHYMDGDVPGNSSAWDGMDLTSTSGQAAPGNTNSNSSKSQSTAKHRESANYIKPTVNILPWNLNMRSQKEIRTEGLFAALNDCLYRTMYRYKYLALVDLDEFIVPRHNDTLNELINALNRGYRNRNTGAYSFQNAFFYLQFPDDPSVFWRNSLNTRLRAALVTQRKTRRRFKLHPQKQRSKYICKPESVVEAGNHFVWEFSPGKGSLNVPPTDAILQHYRVCEFGGNDCIKAPSVIDRTATKYANRLLQRVDAVYKYLKQRCDLPELPVLPDPPQTEPSNSKTSNDNNKETKKSNEVITKKSQTETIETKSNHNNNNNDTTNTKTTRTETISTKAPPTTPTADSAAKLSYLSKKRKMIVFEEGEDGLPMAKVQYLK